MRWFPSCEIGYGSCRPSGWAGSAAIHHLIKVVDLDVTDIDSVQTTVAEIIGKTGRIDVLVNNAGVVFAGPTETLAGLGREYLAPLGRGTIMRVAA